MTVRIFNSKPQAIPTPQTHGEWHDLMVQAIAQAERTGDRRADGLRRALVEGKSEAHLRRLGIISPTCIRREFPEKAT